MSVPDDAGEGSSASQEGAPLSTDLMPVRPQGRYAAFVAKGQDQDRAQAFVFAEDFLEIHVVSDESEIPGEVLSRAHYPQRGGSTASAAGPSGRLPAADRMPMLRQERPVIFKGNIDLVSGPVAQLDVWTAEYRQKHGELVDVQTLYDGTKDDEGRGPPSGRQIYIIGKIRSASSPEAFGWSLVGVSLLPVGGGMKLDLRPPRAEMESYLRMKQWAEELAVERRARDPFRPVDRPGFRRDFQPGFHPEFHPEVHPIAVP